jgi:hypothetical protein
MNIYKDIVKNSCVPSVATSPARPVASEGHRIRARRNGGGNAPASLIIRQANYGLRLRNGPLSGAKFDVFKT